MAKLSFITPIAYDYRFVPEAVAAYYSLADEIVLGLDADLISWSGQKFSVDLDWLWAQLKPIDTRGIIRIEQGDFHSAGQPMENDAAERRALASRCKTGNWVVQIDSDEVLLNGPEFAAYMDQAKPGQGIYAAWVTVYKTFENDVLVVDDDWQLVQVASQSRDAYLYARQTPEPQVLSPMRLLHYGWGRSEAELAQKLTHWSHSKDFDVPQALAAWRNVTLQNYAQARDLHPIYGPQWPRLKRLPLEAAALRQAALDLKMPKRFPNRLDAWARKLARLGRRAMGRA